MMIWFSQSSIGAAQWIRFVCRPYGAFDLCGIPCYEHIAPTELYSRLYIEFKYSIIRKDPKTEYFLYWLLALKLD
jgi:hypothetical protein